MESYQIISHRDFQELIGTEELLEITGISERTLKYFLEFELIEPVESKNGAVLFDIAAVPRIRMIQRLRADIGINLAGIAIILNLQERIQRLQQELAKFC